MKWVTVAAAMVALTALVAGCSGGFRDTLHRLAARIVHSRRVPPRPPTRSSPRRRPSVVKVHGESESCQKITDGSGFVVAPNKVMTNAHVVAGAETFSVDDEGKTLEAQVISYDPQADIAILDVPGLPAAPLKFAEYTVGTGVDALVLGFPAPLDFRPPRRRSARSPKSTGPTSTARRR